jgi:carbonic anhydrase/acetyltransferase-like protein (isoleucine patch superfamily)
MTEIAPPLVLAVNGIAPRIAPDVFIAPGAVVVGDVEIGPGSSVWFNATIRGDVAPVRIGARSNVQEGAVLHVDRDCPCVVGDDVTIGHRAIVHGTTVGNGVTVGMGSILLSRSRIGDRAIVAAGAVVAEGAEVAAGALVMGIPAREKRILEEERQLASVASAAGYVANAARFKETLADVTALWRAQQNGDDGDGG